MQTLIDMYGEAFLENVKIITIAPELDGVLSVIPEIKKKGIVISAGHSASNIETGIKAVEKGVSLITRI